MTLFPRSHSIRNRKVCDFSLPRYAQRQQHSGLLSQDFLGRFADRDRISVKIHWRGCGGGTDSLEVQKWVSEGPSRLCLGQDCTKFFELAYSLAKSLSSWVAK